ncbi:four-helix bundle copper-binding protein [Clostridium sp. HMP27]|uniref:four-helix bundle copper-binding protein n=1 Tax=Clostridium sp. HMP27 TaxID=1487921 RepID=UPI00052C30AE|nr:four-helix bundle copper-binding protein [Clostridium sp. HMP27]KGK88624.1 ferredoxin [Clostridium sp. HMP27]
MPATMNMPAVSLMPGGNPHQTCIEACMKRAQICQECLTMCLQGPDVSARINCIKTLQDCAEICSTAACYMARGSMNTKEICNVCSTICEKCAAECEMFKDEHCQTSADICRQCDNECRRMVNM